MTQNANILDEIVAHKKNEVVAQKQQTPLSEMTNIVAQNYRPFAETLIQNTAQKTNAIIAEIKKASPSKGVLKQDFDVSTIAKNYQKGGASCLSILTDEAFFQGRLDNIALAKQSVDLPILRKDFVIDAYQIHQSKALGADCILLIATILDDAQMHDFYQLATDIGLDVLIEVHNANELKRALKLKPRLIGINNRNLTNFDVNLNTTFDLLAQIPSDVCVITESGINTHADIAQFNKRGVYAFLIGETLMCADNANQTLQELL